LVLSHRDHRGHREVNYKQRESAFICGFKFVFVRVNSWFQFLSCAVIRGLEPRRRGRPPDVQLIHDGVTLVRHQVKHQLGDLVGSYKVLGLNIGTHVFH